MNKYYAVSIGVLAAFVCLSVLVAPQTSNLTITDNDRAAFLSVNNSHISALNNLMILLTEYGREAFWGITTVLLFILGGWAGRKTAIVIVLSIIVLVPTSYAAKDIVQRLHPAIPASDFLIASDPTEYSFPSGHATIVSACAAVALSLFRDSKRRIAISLGLAVESAMVSVSRVYVGGHYPLDVLGGILLGIGVSFIFISGVKKIERLMQSIIKRLRG